jgi:hypothetical protein
MAKRDMVEALDAWRRSEAKYLAVIEEYLDADDPEKIDKAAALAITKARVKADKHLDAYLHGCLG